VHVIPTQAAAAKFKYEVVSVTNTAPGQTPVATIRVVDPTNNNAPYDITAPGNPFLTGSGRLVVDIAWSTNTSEFTNRDTPTTTATSAPFQPLQITFTTAGSAAGVTNNGNGTFTKAATVAIPATASGTGLATLEGRPVVPIDTDLNPSTPPVLTSLAVPNGSILARITDTTAKARVQLVSIQKCNDCHQQLSLHGSNRTNNTDLCANCHNPNATDIQRRVAISNAGNTVFGTANSCVAATGSKDDESIDFKFMVHSIHAGADYKVCGNGNTAYDFLGISYPGRLNNCEGCHLANTYYPNPLLIPVTRDAAGTTVDAGGYPTGDRFSTTDDIGISGQSATCFACHRSTLARTHMEQNGGVFNARKNADGSQVGGNQETCTVCHGPGRTGDVKEVHGIGNFRFN
jgi:OmcA/MtrC family decaheme c-type cytochrome